MFRLWDGLVLATCMGVAFIACSGGTGAEGPITGTVFDSDGNPAVGTVMSLDRRPIEGENRAYSSRSRLSEAVFAGFNGTFSIPDPGEAGPLVLKASHMDFAEAYLEVQRGQTGIEVILEKGWTLTAK